MGNNNTNLTVRKYDLPTNQVATLSMQKGNSISESGNQSTEQKKTYLDLLSWKFLQSSRLPP